MTTATATLITIHIGALVPRPDHNPAVVAVAWLEYVGTMPFIAIVAGPDALAALQHIYTQANGLSVATRGARN